MSLLPQLLNLSGEIHKNMRLSFAFILYVLSSCITSYLSLNTQTPSYSCYENNSSITFTFSFADHSAEQASRNCLLSRCNVSSSNNSTCLASLTPCFDYRSWNNTSYCAPAIDCSILTPCDNITNQCASNTSVCVVNSCCSPQAICLPLFATEICTANLGILNSTGRITLIFSVD